MKLEPELTDTTILAEIGERLAYRRIALGLTQADAAREAGVSKRTLERIEAGEAVQTPNLVRVLRQLQLLDRLDDALPDAAPGPVDVLRRRDARRKRAPRARAKTTKPWRWGDE